MLVVVVELRALVRLEGVLDRQLVQPELVLQLLQLVAVGVAQVDPDDRVGLARGGPTPPPVGSPPPRARPCDRPAIASRRPVNHRTDACDVRIRGEMASSGAAGGAAGRRRRRLGARRRRAGSCSSPARFRASWCAPRSWPSGATTPAPSSTTSSIRRRVRTSPPCPFHAAGCGGCAWQHIDPDAQRELKRGIVVEALARTGRPARRRRRASVPAADTVGLPHDGADGRRRRSSRVPRRAAPRRRARRSLPRRPPAPRRRHRRDPRARRRAR